MTGAPLATTAPGIGLSLDEAYASQGGTLAVFSPKVADYVRSRPGYPAALFDGLRVAGVLPAAARVADVGAGSGLLTAGLLARGHAVVAVEPNADMRASADAQLGRDPRYASVAGRAESMPLPDSSVDVVTAAQAFHWFDPPAARRECLRVLAPAGQVVLVWNDRVLDDPLHVALDEIFARYGGARRGALLAHEDRSRVAEFFGTAQPAAWTLPHEHRLDRAGLASLVFSRSYMPLRDTLDGRQAGRKVDRLFDDFAGSAGVAVPIRYCTVAYAARPRVENTR